MLAKRARRRTSAFKSQGRPSASAHLLNCERKLKRVLSKRAIHLQRKSRFDFSKRTPTVTGFGEVWLQRSGIMRRWRSSSRWPELQTRFQRSDERIGWVMLQPSRRLRRLSNLSFLGLDQQAQRRWRRRSLTPGRLGTNTPRATPSGTRESRRRGSSYQLSRLPRPRIGGLSACPTFATQKSFRLTSLSGMSCSLCFDDCSNPIGSRGSFAAKRRALSEVA